MRRMLYHLQDINPESEWKYFGDVSVTHEVKIGDSAPVDIFFAAEGAPCLKWSVLPIVSVTSKKSSLTFPCYCFKWIL